MMTEFARVALHCPQSFGIGVKNGAVLANG
jgi:hypothetical protein